MKRLRTAVFVAALAAPVAALAGDAGSSVLSLKEGVVAELLGKTMGIAKGLFALSLVVALLTEAFGGAPTQTKNYAGVAWRALVVLALLSGYRVVFGTIIATSQSVADRIAPESIYTAFGERNIQSIQRLRQQVTEQDSKDTDAGGLTGWVTSGGKVVRGYVGGALFDGLVLVCVALGQAFTWMFTQLSRILVTVLYLLGPIALVFAIPGSSDAAKRWFRNFVTVAAWPIFSSLLLAICTALLMRTDRAAVFGEYGTAFGALGTTLLMSAMCLATPVLASAVIGGTLKNVPLTSLMEMVFVAGAVARATATTASAGAGAAGVAAPGGGAAAGAGGVPGGGGSPPPQHPGPSSGAVSVEPSGAALTTPASAEGGGNATPELASGVPTNVQVAAASAPDGALDATVAGGRGLRKGYGTYAGAAKLRRVGGKSTKDLQVPAAVEPVRFQEPTIALPAHFNPANWDDVGLTPEQPR